MTNQKRDSGVYHDGGAFPQLIFNVLYIEIIVKVSSLDPGRKSSGMWGTQRSRKAVLRKLPLVPLHQRIPQHDLGETGLRGNFLGLLKMPCSKRLTRKTPATPKPQSTYQKGKGFIQSQAHHRSN